MEITRRGFFGLLAAIPFVQRLVPIQYCPEPSTFADIDAITRDVYLATSGEYFKDGPLLAYLRSDEYRFVRGDRPSIPLSDPL